MGSGLAGFDITSIVDTFPRVGILDASSYAGECATRLGGFGGHRMVDVEMTR